MTRYRITNWREYNRALKNRGSLIFYLPEDVLTAWRAPRDPSHFGRPFLYSDDLIKAALVVKMAYGLPYRGLEGFLESVVELKGLDMEIPCYTQICKRAKTIPIPKTLSGKRPQHIVFDSSGLKVYGEGEWHVKVHGASKRRRWLKLHVGVCPITNEILVAEATSARVADSKMLPPLLERVPKSVRRVYGDGGYDTKACYDAIARAQAEPVIPPRSGGIVQANSPNLRLRNEAICIIEELGGDSVARSIWKKYRDYHRRSLVETCFSRLKGLFGPRLSSREPVRQRLEALLRCETLNRITRLGMPKSYAL